jgi:adenine-specific DNA-methyltransferase
MIDLNKEYSRDHFLQILRVFDTSFSYSAQKYDFTSKVFLSASRLGIFEVLETEIIEVEVSSDVKNRLTITKEAFKLKRSSAYANAIVAFINPDSSIWRLSLLTTEYSIDEQGVQISNSNPKRFSYLLGPGTKVATPTKNVLHKGTIKDLDDLKSRFSVEVVNKDFYNGIADSFTRLIGGNRKVSDEESYYNGLILPDSNYLDIQEKQEFSVRLIGRLIFLWFLKQKKTESESALIPETMLSVVSVQQNKGYYKNILLPLFFEVLNTTHSDRKFEFRNYPYNSIPYLNGGLFSPHKTDHYYDENYGYLNISDEWFIFFFDLLETFNFTIDENSSIDLELSIDPEMLGRIFENLIAEINPETGKNARKSTGSFYTPREIVDFMVSESLYEYLSDSTSLGNKQLLNITSTDFGITEDYKLNTNEIKSLFIALSKVKVIDPACGSGAFPMGILQRIIHIESVLDPEGRIWFETNHNGISAELQYVLSEKYYESGYMYLRKLKIIKDNIFGVDIQPIAIEISKLRCFLSLIVDEVVDSSLKNMGIEPLPNLEFKFICANSLMPIQNHNQISLFDDDTFEESLLRIRDEYFLVHDKSGKEDLKKSFEVLLEKKMNFSANTDKTIQLSTWTPFEPYMTSQFFDSMFMFNVDSFDVIIMNPPYLGEKGNKEQFRLIRSGGLKEYYERKMDLFYFFIHLAINLSKENAVISTITTNYFLTATGAKKLRDRIKANAPFLKLINFNELKLFSSAVGQHNIISIMKKNLSHQRDVELTYVKHKGQATESIITRILSKKDNLSDYSKTPLSELFEKPQNYINFNSMLNDISKSVIDKIRVRNEVDLIVNMGVQSGADFVTERLINQARRKGIIDQTRFEELLNEVNNGIYVVDDSFIENLNHYEKTNCLRKFIKNSNIYKYKTIESHINYLYVDSHTPKDMIPNIIDHLSKYRDILSAREQVQNKENSWYWIRGSKRDQLGDRNKVNIVCPYRNKTNVFTLSKSGEIGAGDTYYISTVNSEVYIEYILAVLNSNLIYFWLLNMGKKKGNVLELYKQPLLEIPIAEAPLDKMIKLKALVNEIYNNPQDEKFLIKKINQINDSIYEIYDLSNLEIDAVESYIKESD